MGRLGNQPEITKRHVARQAMILIINDASSEVGMAWTI